MPALLADIPWVVCDFETTGIHPAYHHRIVEIGLVYGTGTEIEGEWSTTVNPQRDVSASDIHGLRAADVMDSPTFEQIAGSVIEMFQGRVPVAHNASFDRNFFHSELDRAGIASLDSEWFCTLQAMSALGIHPTNLAACCASIGVPISDAHEALADARGCAGLITHEYARLAQTMSRVPRFDYAGSQLATAAPCPRGSGVPKIQRRLSDLPLALNVEPLADTADLESYLQLLTRVLEDRRVTDDEYEALLLCASELHISGDDVLRIHRSYLGALKRKFLEDGVLSVSEQRDLDAITSLLGISEQELTADDLSSSNPLPAEESLVGQTVCFTGELEATISGGEVSRSYAQLLAADAGLVVKTGVSKKLDILVTVDPDSLSGKARKARELGVRVIAEQAFWSAIGVDVD